MNALQGLKTFLSLVGTTGITNVYFDLNQMINTDRAKTYPFVFWDLSSIKFNEDIRQGIRKFTITAYMVDQYIQEETITGESKIKTWDDLHTMFVAYINYLESIKAAHAYTFVELNSIDGEYYDRGQTSVDEELGIGYKMSLEAYC